MPKEAVFGLEGDGHSGGDVVGGEGGDAYAEVDVVAVLQLFGGAGGELVAGQRYRGHGGVRVTAKTNHREHRGKERAQRAIPQG